MAIYNDSEIAYAVFGKLFQILTEDKTFTSRLRESNLSVRLIHTSPEAVVHVSPDGVLLGESAPESAAVSIKMSCDTAHKLWNGTLLMPAALAMGKVRIKGKVANVLELVPILQPAFDRYPEIAAAHGISDAA
jgi:putative sterol carrier protein